MAGWAVLVVWNDGTEEYLRHGSAVARFSSSARAADQRDFMLIGMEGEVQSINVVPAPRERRASARRAKPDAIQSNDTHNDTHPGPARSGDLGGTRKSENDSGGARRTGGLAPDA